MKSILWLLFLFSPFFLSADHSDILLVSPDKIDAYVQRTKEHILQAVGQINSVPEDQKNFANTIRPWNRLASEVVGYLGILYFFARDDAFPTHEKAASAMQELQNFVFFAVMRNIDLYRSLVSYAKTISQESNPYECYVVHHLLETCESLNASLSDLERQELEALVTSTALLKGESFRYLKGEALEKTSGDLTVFSLNTCFLPGSQSLLFGGVLPWEERVDALAEKILMTDANVVCLQEVFLEDAGLALFEKLKKTYVHFYLAIGPRLAGFSPQGLGLPSGLFVASKYRIKDPTFSLFEEIGVPMNFGFFDFIIENETASIGHIYSTHLQSLNYDRFAQIRALELKQILDKMQADFKENVPSFLCGDLNIPWGEKEPGELLMQSAFIDALNKDHKQVDENNRTFTEYFTNYFLSPIRNEKEIDPDFEILDYALLLPSSAYTLDTIVIPMNTIGDPQTALSDHHALLTTIHAR